MFKIVTAGSIFLLILSVPPSSPRPTPQDDDNLLAPWAVAVGIPALGYAAAATVMLTALGQYKFYQGGGEDKLIRVHSSTRKQNTIDSIEQISQLW